MLSVRNADHPAQLSELLLFWIIAVWALIFSRIEHWQYFDAVYFCVVTTLTCGFGDCWSSRLDSLALSARAIGRTARCSALILSYRHQTDSPTVTSTKVLTFPFALVSIAGESSLTRPLQRSELQPWDVPTHSLIPSICNQLWRHKSAQSSGTSPTVP
jgi:hypothetical protein